MAGLVTLGVVLVLAVLLAIKVTRDTRRPRRKQAREAPAESKADRERKEEALMEQVAAIRKKQEKAVADAIHDDPERAAKVMRRMMRDKG